MTETVFVIIRADRTYRVAKRPRVSKDEVAVRLRLSFPDSWGREVATVDLTMPEMVPAVKVDVEPPPKDKAAT